MRQHVVVVVDDDAPRCRAFVRWLKAYDVPAMGFSSGAADKPIMARIREIRPRVVLCRPGSTGIGLFHPLRSMKEPPMLILLSESKSAADEVRELNGLIVASIRTPVPMAPLCKFVGTALSIAARLDASNVPPAAQVVVHPAARQFNGPALAAARAREHLAG